MVPRCETTTKVPVPFVVVLGDDGGDGADAGVGCRKGGAVVTDDKDDLALDAKVADLAKEHVGLLVKARDGKHGGFDCVLIVDPSRLSRSTEGYTLIGQKLNRHGIRVYTPQGKIQLPPPHAFFYSRYHKEGENDFGPGK